MKIVVVGSGSSGNCTYVDTGSKKILIDCGVSYIQLKNRLYYKGITLGLIDAVFITHEHGDHIKNLTSILTKTKASLYIEPTTYDNAERKLRTCLGNYDVHFIKPNVKYEIGNLTMVPIRLSHDTENCVGYLGRLDGDEGYSFACITDTGYVDSKYYELLTYMNVLILESNHDIDMLECSSRPQILIDRIKSNCGHLSNIQCLDILKHVVSDKTNVVVLAHISEECNDYELAKNNILEGFDNNPPFELLVAKQHEALPVITIGEDND